MYCSERFVKPMDVLRPAGGALALVRLFTGGLRFLLGLPLRGEPLREPEVRYLTGVRPRRAARHRLFTDES